MYYFVERLKISTIKLKTYIFKTSYGLVLALIVLPMQLVSFSIYNQL